MTATSRPFYCFIIRLYVVPDGVKYIYLNSLLSYISFFKLQLLKIQFIKLRCFTSSLYKFLDCSCLNYNFVKLLKCCRFYNKIKINSFRPYNLLCNQCVFVAAYAIPLLLLLLRSRHCTVENILFYLYVKITF